MKNRPSCRQSGARNLAGTAQPEDKGRENKEGFPLAGVETQSGKYTKGLPDGLPAWSNPLPFSYESTGIESRFTNGLDPFPRSRPVFSFHRAETLAEWPEGLSGEARNRTFLARMQHMPALVEQGLWPAQIKAVKNLERSLAVNRPRSLIQMATGSGKIFTAITFIYRLIEFAGARRVLFLVDRGNLGRQTLKEFQQFVSPYNNFKFSEEYIVQRLASNALDTTARVCISTIQRLYSMLKGQTLAEEDEEQSVECLRKKREEKGTGWFLGDTESAKAACLLTQSSFSQTLASDEKGNEVKINESKKGRRVLYLSSFIACAARSQLDVLGQPSNNGAGRDATLRHGQGCPHSTSQTEGCNNFLGRLRLRLSGQRLSPGL